jgi:hypothetical protein
VISVSPQFVGDNSVANDLKRPTSGFRPFPVDVRIMSRGRSDSVAIGQRHLGSQEHLLHFCRQPLDRPAEHPNLLRNAGLFYLDEPHETPHKEVELLTIRIAGHVHIVSRKHEISGEG